MPVLIRRLYVHPATKTSNGLAIASSHDPRFAQESRMHFASVFMDASDGQDIRMPLVSPFLSHFG